MSDIPKDWEQISISAKDLEDLKKLYADAVKTGKESFMFKGKELVTGFAKYWIQYIESKIETSTQCPQCGKLYKPILDWPEGDDRNIQDIFPDAERWVREQLITGICSQECWDEFLGKE